MKIIIFVFITLVGFCSCDPDNKDIFNTEFVKLMATISDTSSVIALGNTLQITVALPDTIVSNTSKYYVHNLQQAQFFMRIKKVDTSNSRSVIIMQPIYWVTRGTISSTNTFDFIFSNTTKPFGVNINFKPIEKGIYYLEVVSQAGKLKINSAYEARLIVDFNVSDRHTDLAAPYFGQAWANESMTRQFGTYVFRVN